MEKYEKWKIKFDRLPFNTLNIIKQHILIIDNKSILVHQSSREERPFNIIYIYITLITHLCCCSFLFTCA